MTATARAAQSTFRQMPAPPSSVVTESKIGVEPALCSAARGEPGSRLALRREYTQALGLTQQIEELGIKAENVYVYEMLNQTDWRWRRVSQRSVQEFAT